MDLLKELQHLIKAFEGQGIDYALCGGLALAVHGLPRATADIDLLVLAQDVDAALDAARQAGFDMIAAPMALGRGAVVIRRVCKSLPQDQFTLPLDLVVVSPELEAAWETAQVLQWGDGPLRVLSPEGLRRMKALRASPQDLADMEGLAALASGAKDEK